ncbi:MAG: TatD family hydrolase [Verrucomicrobiota bacterium]
MCSGLIDCHLHLQDSRILDRADQIVREAREVGVRHFLVNGTRPQDWDEVERLASEFIEVTPNFGWHPWYVGDVSPDWEGQLQDLLDRFPIAGIGEIGLDGWIKGHDIGLQRDVFLRQMELAREKKRAVTIHCLKAWGHLLDCLESIEWSAPFLLHSYSGPREMIDKFLALGAYFSLSGYFFHPNKREKLETFEAIPKERILLETDAPDMSLPKSLEEARLDPEGNHPSNLAVVYQQFAIWQGEPLGSIQLQMKRNAEAWFGQAFN